MRGIRSSNKRKWVVGGAVIFAAAALLTTGFATWIVGGQNRIKDNNVNVTVDTAENNFLEFSYDLSDDAIKLAETSAKYEQSKTDTNKIVNLESDEPGATTPQYEEHPMRITGQVVILVGRSYLQNYNITGIDFSILAKATGEEADEDEASVIAAEGNNFLKDANKVGSVLRAEAADYTYIKAPVKETFAALTTEETQTGWDVTVNGDMYTFKKTLSVDVRWGSFFGNDETENNSPYDYYNGLALSSTITAEQKANVYGAVTGELTAMHDQLDGNHIRLRAELTSAKKSA